MTSELLPSEDVLRAAFEEHYRRENESMKPEEQMETWLKRDDIWAEGGYAQPTTHFDWMYFKAGAEWATKNK